MDGWMDGLLFLFFGGCRCRTFLLATVDGKRGGILLFGFVIDL